MVNPQIDICIRVNRCPPGASAIPGMETSIQRSDKEGEFLIPVANRRYGDAHIRVLRKEEA